MKFSIIIPVYNTEKYLKRCLDSVLNQTYDNYEMIVINDGSTDNSKLVLNEYKSNSKIKIIEETNHGVSYTRNLGMEHAQGDYILFLDSDDYYELDLLETLSKNITDEEMLRFNYYELKNETKTSYKTLECKNKKGKEIFKDFIESKIMIETPWMYAIKKEYMSMYKFSINKYHEDFGLMPIMLYHCNNFSSINYTGYIYNRENEISITSYTCDDKELKKAMDTLYFFKEVKLKEKDPHLLSFYSNGAILRIKNLSGNYKKEYIKELKKEKVYNYVLTNNIKRKMKKIFLKIFFTLH